MNGSFSVGLYTVNKDLQSSANYSACDDSVAAVTRHRDYCYLFQSTSNIIQILLAVVMRLLFVGGRGQFLIFVIFKFFQISQNFAESPLGRI